MFAAVGIHEAHAEELKTALVVAAREAETEPGTPNVYGQRYIIDFEMQWQGRVVKNSEHVDRTAGEDLPRLTSCYVL